MPDGTRIATWIGGTTTGRPVVFLHGFCGDHAAMRPLAQAVADKRPVILYDARGHGQSDDFGTPALMQTLAEDLLAVLNAHAPSGADVVGLSMGAQTIFETLRLTGDASFVRFVFIDQSPCIASGPDWPHGLFGEAAAADIAAARAEIAAQPRKLANAWLRGLWRSDERLGMKLLLSPSMLTGLRHVPDATLRLADDMLQQDWRHEVRQLTKPILLLYGGRSIYPGAGRWMADTLPHAELELFESSGHALVLEQPARAARALRRFLTSA
ncbi:MAG: alpha/beta hydrolase [Myxococcales bacterium]|nr:alpha/beta hydrolase [Myxococcales bacterium]